MRSILALLALLLLAAPPPAGAADLRQGDLLIGQPWLRATIGNLRMTAGYLAVTNAGATADRLLAVEIPGAAMVELHVTENGAMRRVDSLEIPAGGNLLVSPGGTHLMVGPLEGPLVEGERLDGILVFAEAGRVAVTFVVAAANAMAPD